MASVFNTLPKAEEQNVFFVSFPHTLCMEMLICSNNYMIFVVFEHLVLFAKYYQKRFVRFYPQNRVRFSVRNLRTK